MGLPKIDEASYAAGRKLFVKGNTIRQLMERTEAIRKEKVVGEDGYQNREEREFSLVVGFMDGMLELLRARR